VEEGTEVLAGALAYDDLGGVGDQALRYLASTQTAGPTSNEVVVYFVCDVDACVTSKEDWPSAWAEQKAWRNAKASWEAEQVVAAQVAKAEEKKEREKHASKPGKKQVRLMLSRFCP
jgi:hypothetical protein